MNNFTFGTENSGYYETIGGGAGAGPDWHGIVFILFIFSIIII